MIFPQSNTISTKHIIGFSVESNVLRLFLPLAPKDGELQELWAYSTVV